MPLILGVFSYLFWTHPGTRNQRLRLSLYETFSLLELVLALLYGVSCINFFYPLFFWFLDQFSIMQSTEFKFLCLCGRLKGGWLEWNSTFKLEGLCSYILQFIRAASNMFWSMLSISPVIHKHENYLSSICIKVGLCCGPPKFIA